MVNVFGQVRANIHKSKNKNWLFISSTQYGKTPIRAILNDEEAKDITSGDYVQLTGKAKRVLHTSDEGTIQYVSLMKPILKHIIHTKRTNLFQKTLKPYISDNTNTAGTKTL